MRLGTAPGVLQCARRPRCSSAWSGAVPPPLLPWPLPLCCRASSSRRSTVRVAARHEKRESAFNAASRRPRRPPGRGGLMGRDARVAIATQYAKDLETYSNGTLSLRSALHLVTARPALMRLPPSLLAERLAAHAGALEMGVADVAELFVRNAQLLDILPFKLRQGADALAAALDCPLPLALVVAAQQPASLTEPPLRTRQQVEQIAAALGLPFAAAAAVVVREGKLLSLQPAALGKRLHALQKLLNLSPPDALALALDEPRLLLPAATLLRQNLEALVSLVAAWLEGAELDQEGAPVIADTPGSSSSSSSSSSSRSSSGRSGSGAGRKGSSAGGAAAKNEARARVVAWARAAPALLIRAAHATAARLASLAPEFARAAPFGLEAAAGALAVATTGSADVSTTTTPANGTSPDAGGAAADKFASQTIASARQTVAAWVDRDPRVLLVRQGALESFLAEDLSDLIMQPRAYAYALAAANPSYLVLRESAGMEGWVADVMHLLQLPAAPVCKLAGDPEVFLTRTPEQILTAVYALSDILGAPFSAARDIALSEPRLLLAAPEAIAAELESLRQLLLAPSPPPSPAAAARGGNTDTSSSSSSGGEISSSEATRKRLSLGPSLLRSVPALLLPGGPGAALRARVSELAAALGVEVRTVIEAAAANREVAEAPPAGAATAAAEMAGSGLMPLHRAAAVVLAQPTLAHLPAERVRSAAEMAVATLQPHARWAAEAASALAPRTLGLLLLQPWSRLPFLEFLIESGQTNQIALEEAATMGQSARMRAFGTELGIWKRKRREAAARRRAREAQRGGAGGGDGSSGGVNGLERHSGGGWDEEEGEKEEGEEEEEEEGSGGSGGGVEVRYEGRPLGPQGTGQTTVFRGVMVGWPGGPNALDRSIGRAQAAAGRLYRRGTAGLLDGHWRAQPWYTYVTESCCDQAVSSSSSSSSSSTGNSISGGGGGRGVARGKARAGDGAAAEEGVSRGAAAGPPVGRRSAKAAGVSGE